MIRNKFFIGFVISYVLVGILVFGPTRSGSQALAQTYTTSTVMTTTATTSTATTMATSTPTQVPSVNIVLCEFTRVLKAGSSGEDVRCLQRYLNRTGILVSTSGAGSLDNETIYFGPLTQQAVTRWQNIYANAVLAPLGLTSGTGIWGNASQNYYVKLVRAALGVK